MSVIVNIKVSGSKENKKKKKKSQKNSAFVTSKLNPPGYIWLIL